MNSPRRWQHWLTLAILLCAATYLVGNGSVPLWDRDEGWYAQSSKQMWETGDWVVPRFLDDLRTEKPVFVYWLHLAGYALFGGPSEFAVRFYASVAQVLVLVIIGLGFVRLVDPARAIWATFAYGSCVMAIVSAKMCLTDATLMVFLTTVQLLLMAAYMGRFRWWFVPVIGVALGFGALTKGLIVLVPPTFTLLALGVMDWRRVVASMKTDGVRRVPMIAASDVCALVIMVGVCTPWLIELHQRAPDWLPRAMNATRAHVTEATYGHEGPIGYHALAIWATYFPWSLLIPMAAYFAWKQRHSPPTRFAIAAVLGPWLFFELMRTKLPHYMLPTYPFLSLLVADAIVLGKNEFSSRGFRIAVAIWAIPVGLVASLPWVATLATPELADLPYVPMAVVSVAGLACTVGTWWLFHLRRPGWACAYLGASFLALVALAFGWMLPQSRHLHVSTRLTDILREHDGIGAPRGEVVTIERGHMGYDEPSLYFYQGGTIRVWDRELETTPPEQWPRLIVITDELMELLQPATREQLQVLGTVRGYLYAADQKVRDVMVVTRK